VLDVVLCFRRQVLVLDFFFLNGVVFSRLLIFPAESSELARSCSFVVLVARRIIVGLRSRGR